MPNIAQKSKVCSAPTPAPTQFAVTGYTAEGGVMPTVWGESRAAKVAQADRLKARGGFMLRVMSKDADGVVREDYTPHGDR
jgi:hypothetical protein